MALSAPVVADIARHLARAPCDLILVCRATMLPALQAFPAGAGPVFLDLDDDDAALLRDRAARAEEGGQPDLARILSAEADATEAMILSASPRIAGFSAASSRDAAMLSARLGLRNMVVLPNSIRFPTGPRPGLARRDALLFVGNLSYVPNVDGICWFLHRHWPLIHVRAPELKLVIAGRSPALAVQEACRLPGVELVADPDDLAPVYDRAIAAIVPLRLGSGTRIKILEAASFGVPVLSTAKGAEGLDDAICRKLHLAEGEAFADACLDLFHSRILAHEAAGPLTLAVRDLHGHGANVARMAEILGSCPVASMIVMPNWQTTMPTAAQSRLSHSAMRIVRRTSRTECAL